MFQYAVGYSIAKEKGLVVSACKSKMQDMLCVNYNIDQGGGALQVYKERHCSQRFDSNIFNIGRNDKIDGFFQTDKYFINHRNNLIGIFALRDKSKAEEVDSFIGSISKPIICMHARFGDYLESTKEVFFADGAKRSLQKKKSGPSEYSFPVMDYDYYVRSIQKVLYLQKKKPSDYHYVFISDDNGGGNVRKLSEKIRDEIGIEVEIFNGGIEKDFQLMKSADICITSASSFSWWASWLNERTNAIISPKYWFNYYLSKRSEVEWLPYDIRMTLKNQYFIESLGFFHEL